MKSIVVALLLLTSTVSASDTTLRVSVTKKTLELTVLHAVDADTAVMTAALMSEEFERISSIQLGPQCSMQHIVVWRRPPAGAYVIVVTVNDSNGRPIQSGFTRVYVS